MYNILDQTIYSHQSCLHQLLVFCKENFVFKRFRMRMFFRKHFNIFFFKNCLLFCTVLLTYIVKAKSLAMARSNLILRVDDMSLASRSQSMEDGMDEGKEDKANLEIILFKQSLQSYTIVSISDGFRRAHRLSLPGQRMTNYLKFLQELAVRQVIPLVSFWRTLQEGW